jgi:hypothetical protein
MVRQVLHQGGHPDVLTSLPVTELDDLTKVAFLVIARGAPTLRRTRVDILAPRSARSERQGDSERSRKHEQATSFADHGTPSPG